MQLFHFHHCKRHLKKRTIALDPLPPAYAVYARENDDNYGRPLTGTNILLFTTDNCLGLHNNGYDDKSSKQKIALLLHTAHKQAIEVYDTFAFSQEEKGVYERIIEKFYTYCNPKMNETYEAVYPAAGCSCREKRLNRL